MKKLLLLLIGALFCGVVYAAEPDTLTMTKSNGEEIMAIRHTEQGASLNIAGFEILLGEKRLFEGGTITTEQRFFEGSATTTTMTFTDIEASGIDFSEFCLCGCGNEVCRCRTCGVVKYGDVSLGLPSQVYVNSKYHKKTSVTAHLNFGFIGFDGNAGDMDLNHGKSISIGVDMRYAWALNIDKTVWVSMGLRPRWDNYVFRNDVTLARVDGDNATVPLEVGRRFKKSKLGVFSLDFPLAMQLRIARVITLETGVYGGLALGDRTKTKFPKVKDKGDWRVNFWHAGATVKLKVKPVPFGIFGSYSFVPLFENGAGPRLQPFTLGIYI